MIKFPKFRKKSTLKNHPNLTREYVEKAVDDYLREGGEITIIENKPPPKDDEKKTGISMYCAYADNFLTDNGPSLKFV